MTPPSTALVARLLALLDALRGGPLPRPALLARLGAAYPLSASARPMVDRDVAHLQALGIVIERSNTRPPVYTLRGGVPTFSVDDLRALALVRDTFGDNHPQAAQMRALLHRLTSVLPETDNAIYQRRQASRAPVQPAIDYTSYAVLIARLETAIAIRQLLKLRYRNSRGGETLHRMVEPYEIEFYERHFYLVAYSHNSGQIHDFRIDRIGEIVPLHTLPPDSARARPLIAFRYRLAAALAQGEISQRFERQRVVERLPNGDVIIEAQGRSDFFIVQTLLRYRGNAELLWPEALRQRMWEEVQMIAKLYHDDD